jgi:IS4 transposase
VIVSSDGKVGDMTAGREMKLWEKLEKGSIVVFDRAYIDFAWWQKLEERGLFFVSRTKSNQSFVVVGQHNAPEGTVLADEYVLRGEGNTSLVYPERLRRVRIAHEDAVYEYVTNNTKLSALQIAEIYTARWHVELFFKWIKQNLTIKAFLGTSENAVLSQVWVAMIYYLLLAYIKFQTKFAKSLLELTRMVRETLLVRRTLIDMLSLSSLTIGRFRPPESPQLRLF